MKFNIDRVVDEFDLKIEILFVKKQYECHDDNKRIHDFQRRKKKKNWRMRLSSIYSISEISVRFITRNCDKTNMFQMFTQKQCFI